MASDHVTRRFYTAAPPGRQVEVGVWKASAGTSVQIPTVQSRVYYFPQGHVEQSSSSTNAISLSRNVTSQPAIHCCVNEVQFLADKDTDEVFAKLRLEPIVRTTGLLLEVSGNGGNGGGGDEGDVVSFAKVLTPSDANNGGGFSVPRFCADSIFPPLDYAAEPPVQNIRIHDVHGEVWDFRHIYRGTPRRHLLTTGWSKFVNTKKLIAGDSVVFMKNKGTEKLSLGIRRTVKDSEPASSSWAPQYINAGAGGVVSGGGFSRSGKGRVPVDAVVDAAERAASGLQFEVVYYPKAGMPDFVVGAEKVEAALSVQWQPGLRVKMSLESEDSTRMTTFQGTIAGVGGPDNGLWRGSSWRMLQVAWDEPEILQNMKRVSPWQVEYVHQTPPVPTPFPPVPPPFPTAKRLRGPMTDGEGDLPLPPVGFGSMMGQMGSSYLNYNTFPAGMQGARQNSFFVPNLPTIMTHGARNMRTDEYLNNMSQNGGAVSTDLNIGSSSEDTPSPESHDSVQLFGKDTSTQSSCKLSEKAGPNSIQLFGTRIYMEQPLTGDEKDVQE